MLIDAHNTLRNIVASGEEIRGRPGPQPSAANMRAVEWNQELAHVAERWAAQCIYGNDVCRDLGKKFSNIIVYCVRNASYSDDPCILIFTNLD